MIGERRKVVAVPVARAKIGFVRTPHPIRMGAVLLDVTEQDLRPRPCRGVCRRRLKLAHFDFRFDEVGRAAGRFIKRFDSNALTTAPGSQRRSAREASRGHAPSSAPPLSIIDPHPGGEAIRVEPLPVHRVGAAPEEIDRAIVADHDGRELEALLFALEVPVSIGHRPGRLEHPALHVDEANRDPLRDVGNPCVFPNVVMKSDPGAAGRSADAGRGRNPECRPDDELAAGRGRDHHARPRAFMPHFDSPALMLRRKLGARVVDRMRDARRPSHDRSTMIRRACLALHRPVVRQVESQNAFFVAPSPREDVQERASVGHRLQARASQVPLRSLFDEGHGASVRVAERA